jgi:hypothetical protein
MAWPAFIVNEYEPDNGHKYSDRYGHSSSEAYLSHIIRSTAQRPKCDTDLSHQTSADVEDDAISCHFAVLDFSRVVGCDSVASNELYLYHKYR